MISFVQAVIMIRFINQITTLTYFFCIVSTYDIQNSNNYNSSANQHYDNYNKQNNYITETEQTILPEMTQPTIMEQKEPEIAPEKPTFIKDDNGSVVILVPQSYWKGKDYEKLKIHLSENVLRNLTSDMSYKPINIVILTFGYLSVCTQ